MAKTIMSVNPLASPESQGGSLKKWAWEQISTKSLKQKSTLSLQPGLTGLNNRWISLIIMLIGPFLGMIDFFIANIGIPSIRVSLGASFSEIELVIAGYGLTYAVCLMTGGRLGDIFGRKLTFISGMASFTLTSLLCGLAPTAGWLIFWRLLQGCAAAVMFPQALSFIQVNFIGSSKRLAFSLYGVATGFGSIVGQLLGGFLIHTNLFGLEWRPIFLINLPIGLATMIAAVLILQESRAENAPKLDLGGVGILTIGLGLFSYPFMEGQERSWPMWIWFCLAASLLVLWAFYLYERRLSDKNLFPLLDPRLCKDRGFVIGLVITCIYFAGHTSMLLVLSLYLQFSLGLDPMHAAFSFVPLSVAFLIGSTFSGKLQGYLGRGSLHVGVIVLAIGIASLALQAKVVPDHLTFSFLATCFLYGIGRGIVTSPLYNTVLGNIPASDAGVASGMVSTMQQLASSVGVAVIGAVVFSVIPKHGATPTDYAHGFVVSLAVNMGMLLIAGLLIFFIPKSRGRDLPAGSHVMTEG